METATLWSRVLRDPQLRDLPYKIETNEFHQLVLSPHKLERSVFQGILVDLLRDHITHPGKRAVEFAVMTSMGVKVPDVVWISEQRWQQIPPGSEASPISPELCIEVLSERNTPREMQEKMDLYFERGSIEVWTCDVQGHIRFYDKDGDLPSSKLVPSFPTKIR